MALMKSFALVCVLLRIACTEVCATDVTPVGATARVPAWQWVTVINPTPLQQVYRNDTVALGVGDTCGIEPGGSVTVIGSDAEGVLVRYSAPGRPMGTPCPSGVEFLLSHEAFQDFTPQALQREEARRRLAERVERLRQQR